MPPRPSMDAIYGGVLLAVGGLLMASTFDPKYQGYGIGSDLSPIFFPRVLLTLWLILAGWIAVRGVAAAGRGPWPRQLWGRAAAVGAAILVFTYAMTLIGFVFAMIPCFIVVGLLLGYRRPVPLLVLGVLVPLATWFAFTEMIEVLLPTSPWFDRI